MLAVSSDDRLWCIVVLVIRWMVSLTCQNTAARLSHGGGGAVILKHYADPVSEVDRGAAVYLARLMGFRWHDRPPLSSTAAFKRELSSQDDRRRCT